MYLTAAHSGLRFSELRQLVWGDVHLDAPRSVHPGQGGDGPKNRREATQFLPLELAEELRKYKPKGQLASGARVCEGDAFASHVQSRSQDGQRSIRSMSSARKVVFHSFRDTYITNLAPWWCAADNDYATGTPQ